MGQDAIRSAPGGTTLEEVAMLATAKQKKQFRDLVGTGAAHGVNIALGELDKDGLDKLLGNGDELRAAVIETVTKKARELSISNQFANEEVSSTYVYPKEYRRVDLIGQTNRLRQLFPGIGFADDKLREAPLPKGAEGWFAIPRWQSFGATYKVALEKVLAKLAETRTDSFYNYRAGALGPGYLRQTDRKIRMMEKIGEAQEGYDILVVGAQFGLRHRGRSVRRACEVFVGNEFGFGAFEVGIMSLTHPERFVRWEQLHTDCAGDEYSPGADGQFDLAPIFDWHACRLEFDAGWFDIAYEYCGSVSAFLPQE